MTKLRTTIALIMMFVMSFGMVGCKSSDVTATLQNVVDIAAITIPIITSAANVPPEVTNQIVTYLGAVSEGTTQASVILADTTLTDAQKAAKITAAFAAIAAPNLPPGTPQNIASAVAKVGDAVAKFLVNFKTSPKLKAGAPTKTPVKPADAAALAKIKAKSEANIQALKAVKTVKK